MSSYAVDQKLLDQAVREGSHRSEDEAINAALAKYVEMIDRLRAWEAVAGTVDYLPGYPRRDEHRRSFQADDDAALDPD